MATVLVVEDEFVIALDLADILEGLGFRVLGPVATGDAACRLALEGLPDLILMDIRIKGDQDGITTAEKILRNLDTRVVFLTAEADRETRRRADAVRPAAYLPKPCSPARVGRVVEQALAA